MEATLGIAFIISSFFYKGKTSVILLYFGLGLFSSFVSLMLREELKKSSKKTDPSKTACPTADMIPDPVRGGYKCSICDFPNSPCPQKNN